MNRRKRKESRFVKMTRTMLIIFGAFFIVGKIMLDSYESSLNIECQDLEKEISTIESDIDGLDMKKSELATFTRIQSIAHDKGYEYKQSTMTAAVVGVPKDR